MRRLALAAASVFGALGLGVSAGAAPAADPGVTSSSVVLGGTIPLSGVASAYASVGRGADAYFKYVNARGGVNGRKIVYKILDDAYDPAQTVQQTRQLVQQDKVFAIYNSLGTEQNLAIRPFLNQLGVPQLFVASGASTWGADAKKYPWTIGYQPSYVAEGIIYGKYLLSTRPRTKIAILYQSDDYGKDLISGLKQGLGGRASRIVASEGYDATAPDVQSQVVKLKGSKADTFMIFATPKYAIQALVYAKKLGWKPLIVVNAVASASNIMSLASEGGTNPRVEGAISLFFVKDPADPTLARDPAITLYRKIMKKYNPRGDAKDVYNVYGMASAYTMVDTLKHAGKNLTRKSVIDAATHLNEPANPFMLPGVRVHTSPNDRFPITQGQLARWHKGRWIRFGGLVSARGR